MIRFMTFGIALVLLAARTASCQDGSVWLWNNDSRKLRGFLDIERTNPPVSDSDAATPFRKMPPHEVWKLAESAGVLPEVPDGYSSFEKTAALHSLLEAIELHPRKSDFVSLMLDKIARTTVPTREPRDWNEISVRSSGGVPGELIKGVMKVAESSEYRRIIKAIAATKDRAKIERLRTEIRGLTDGADLEKFLDHAESGAPEPVEVKTEASLVLPHSGRSADTQLETSPAFGGTVEEADPPRVQMENRPPTKTGIIVAFLVAVSSVLWLLNKRRS